MIIKGMRGASAGLFDCGAERGRAQQPIGLDHQTQRLAIAADPVRMGLFDRGAERPPQAVRPSMAAIDAQDVPRVVVASGGGWLRSSEKDCGKGLNSTLRLGGAFSPFPWRGALVGRGLRRLRLQRQPGGTAVLQPGPQRHHRRQSQYSTSAPARPSRSWRAGGVNAPRRATAARSSSRRWRPAAARSWPWPGRSPAA